MLRASFWEACVVVVVAVDVVLLAEVEVDVVLLAEVDEEVLDVALDRVVAVLGGEVVEVVAKGGVAVEFAL